MIEWLKAADGSWKFDYSIFDDYVNWPEAGVDGAMRSTPVPWVTALRYLDETSGNYI
jgi:hypothetical protein